MIIGISGRMRSGKDTLAAELQVRFGGTTLSFARQLKRCAATIWGEMPRDDRSRSLLQQFGTDAVRAIDPDAWLKAWFRELMRICGPEVINSRSEHVYVPDVRFPNELSLIQTLGGCVIRLDVTADQQRERGGNMNFADHSSETALDGNPWFDLVVPSGLSGDRVVTLAVQYLYDQHNILPGRDSDAAHDPEAVAVFLPSRNTI